METAQQARKAEQLRKLHEGPRILILANAWDVISARIMEDAGFPAVATTIAGVREASAAAGVPLVINARTDVYLMPIGPEETRFERTVERLRTYRKAGADCVFAPGIREKETIGRLVRAVDAPLNILLQPGGPTVAELEKFGVARAIIGSVTMRAALGTARQFANALS